MDPQPRDVLVLRPEIAIHGHYIFFLFWNKIRKQTVTGGWTCKL